MIEIEISEKRAVIQNQTWRSDVAVLARLLNDDLAVRPVPLQYEPWPDLAIAQEAANRYRGRIVRQQAPAFGNHVY